jgi:hypothetical protein
VISLLPGKLPRQSSRPAELGEAIGRDIELPRERKNAYKANGIALYLKKEGVYALRSRG